MQPALIRWEVRAISEKECVLKVCYVFFFLVVNRGEAGVRPGAESHHKQTASPIFHTFNYHAKKNKEQRRLKKLRQITVRT